MIIGCVREVLPHEYRVGLTPAGVGELTKLGHRVLIESGAGKGSRFSDDAYESVGAELLPKEKVWKESALIVKVKEPRPEEYTFLRKGLILFTFFHLAAHQDLTQTLLDAGVTSIAYETIEDAHRRLPLLTPMSEVAGKLSVQAGAWFLQQNNKGFGILIGGVPGVAPAKVTVLGGGVSGKNAVRVAHGMGGQVTVLDINAETLRWFDDVYRGEVRTLWSNGENIRACVEESQLVIGTVLIPGAAAPKLVTREMIRSMQPGSVVVDISVDQGGCFETTRATNYLEPTFVEEDVIHYCVANMPGGTPNTSTLALTNVTLGYLRKLVTKDWKVAIQADPGFLKGLNTHEGKLTYKAVADAFGMEYTTPESALKG
jgi:alanine dehydrogenase